MSSYDTGVNGQALVRQPKAVEQTRTNDPSHWRTNRAPPIGFNPEKASREPFRGSCDLVKGGWLEQVRHPEDRSMRIDADVMRAGVGIGNMLVAILDQQGPSLTEQVTGTETDFEIEIEGLADNTRVDISCRQAGAGLDVGDKVPARLHEIVAGPESHSSDVTTGSVEDVTSEAFAEEFKIATPPSITSRCAQHITELALANGIVNGGSAVVGEKRRKEYAACQTRLVPRSAKQIVGVGYLTCLGVFPAQDNK